MSGRQRGRRRPVRPRRPAARPRVLAGRRLRRAQWPSRLTRRSGRRQRGAAGRAVAGGGARARARVQPHRAASLVHRRHRDAGLRLPEAARARAGLRGVPPGIRRARPGGRARQLHRRTPAQGRALVAGRRAPRSLRLRRRGGRAPAPGAGPEMPLFAGGAVGYFGYDLVRTVEPLGEPNPDPVGLPDMALMLSDVLVVFDHLRHTISVLVNVYADDDDGTDLDTAYAGAVATIAKARELLAGPVPRPAPTPARPRPGSSPTCRASSSRPTSRGSSSTSTPATRFRSCPRSAGRRTSTSTRSRSTAGCASSTRARTCTSWTSWTSRSPAPRPSPS